MAANSDIVVVRAPSRMHAWREAHPAQLGLVPTMGYLHEGHLSLVRRAKEENDLVAVSIFVNPTQFGPNEDFDRYPRDEENDLALLAAAEVDVVYAPTVDVMYPPGSQTRVAVGEITKQLEGASRPGHFEGVTTVVSKLFNATSPNRAYFGRKDAQQLRVIQRMTLDLDMPVEIIPCDTRRESDGLAMSSRNAYLSDEHRAAASVIHRALLATAARFELGERNAKILRGFAKDMIAAEPLADVEYVSLADSESLIELDGDIEAIALLSVAVRFGATRLIDNIELDPM